MVQFSDIFRKAAKERTGRPAGAARTKRLGLAKASEAKEERGAFAELEKAASLYAAQLEKATRELGYNLKDYEEAGAR